MNYQESIRRVIEEETTAIQEMENGLHEDELDRVVELIRHRQGKVIFLGVGKSAHIAKKLAATFSSTGTPSFFVHGTEACHGDLGMIESKDIVILISNSGSTKEVIQNIVPLQRIGATLVAFTSRENSPLAQACPYRILYRCTHEADRNDLAPSNSSTIALVLGDAIALTLSESYGFTKEDFFKFHPNGALGESLKKELQQK